jgi:oligopeptide transport system substrate-binding protein
MRTHRKTSLLFFRGLNLCVVFVIFLGLAGCTQFERPVSEPFYSPTTPPAKQELRWSNGRAPKSLDPARAAAAPETDIVRAIFEGLTETDSRSLQAMPAVAERWTSSPDARTWTFYLRENAKWTNGKPVTARDFVRSWTRLAEMRRAAAHSDLLANFVGLPLPEPVASPSPGAAPVESNRPAAGANANSRTEVLVPGGSPAKAAKAETAKSPPLAPAGIPGFVALSDRVLEVHLVLPDRELPKLLANPIFRPVSGDGSEFATDRPIDIATNGAFRLVSYGAEGVSVVRSGTYWNQGTVRLERIDFVPMPTADAALEAYRAGMIDAVTNTEFAPLALKLLTPFDDFRRTPHGGLNFYEVNTTRPPYSDQRVREALAISIERERLTEGELEGATQAAFSFFPFGRQTGEVIAQDKARGRQLLSDAGFPEGRDFPVIQLVVNRNDAQLRIARTVARMWLQSLNLETEIRVVEPDEIESIRSSGEFDLIRRGVVFPTADTAANLVGIFGRDHIAGRLRPPVVSPVAGRPEKAAAPNVESLTSKDPGAEGSTDGEPVAEFGEAEAMLELKAIPLYFPTSYALVKPYVMGFDVNSLDMPFLNQVAIDSDWQLKKPAAES